MGKLLCENFLRDVWCRNESVRAEIGQILHTHTHRHTHAAKLIVEITTSSLALKSLGIRAQKRIKTQSSIIFQEPEMDDSASQ